MKIQDLNLIILYTLFLKQTFSQCCKCKDYTDPSQPCVCETNQNYCIYKQKNNLCVDLNDENMFRNNVAAGIKGGDCYENGQLVYTQNETYQKMRENFISQKDIVLQSLICFGILIKQNNEFYTHIVTINGMKARTKNYACLSQVSLDSLDKTVFPNEELFCCNIKECGKIPICFDPKEKGESCIDRFCDNCQNGQYPDQNARKCLNCDSSCQKCFGQLSNQCLGCNPPKALYNGRCVIGCPPQTYKLKQI